MFPGEEQSSPCPRLRKTNRAVLVVEPQTSVMVGRRTKGPSAINVYNNNTSNNNTNTSNKLCQSPSEGSVASVSLSGSSSGSYHDFEAAFSEPLHDRNNHSNHSDDTCRTPTKSRSTSWRTTFLQLCLAIKGLSLKQLCLLAGLIILCVPFCVHRTIVWYKGSKAWVMSPIMHLERQCPPPTYPTLTATAEGRSKASHLKICLTTLTDEKTKHSSSLFRRFIRWRNYDNILDLTWKSKQDYANKHGYHLFDSSDVVQTGRPAQWSKIEAVQRLLVEEKYDWALWMDADTLFMNTDKKIEDFLPADPDKDLVVAVDVPNPGYNSGSWLVKNSEWGLSFLQNWWDMKTFVRLPGQSLSGDNDAFKVLLKSIDEDEFAQHVAVPPRCTINAFAKFLRPWEMEDMTDQELQAQPWYMSENFYHKGDWLVHVPGYDNKAGTLQMLMEEIQ